MGDNFWDTMYPGRNGFKHDILTDVSLFKIIQEIILLVCKVSRHDNTTGSNKILGKVIE
jgi:hypothetical protein